ncbi:adenylate/guanylate cyclase [Cribrihabitans marinus]|uniref:Adenylate/guanylate cyclase n=1 Tax=Cribrihabitans marinus TaxID=1227549 RepID=A0A1H7BJX4_9RHOB|nr:adenylate/guanylate cyclase domain-containing protein [Cribrihabitans marinus]GGH34314.1 adenylate/guanylate cyclase domain-containing protein [Cribrihabitans marinus]SEJ78043.1 adenylate/guanylate cyclase [Cribrihabitans marinus]
MANVLWHGDWIARTRIISGLILFTHVLFHFLNIGTGLISPEAMDTFQEARQVITRSLVGSILLYGALLTHAGLALWRVAERRTLRLPPGEALQVALGLLIPLLLIPHLVHTRYAHEIHEVNDRISYIVILIWDSISVWNQSLLLLIVWIHGCIGLHFWLRLTRWWRRAVPWLIGVAVLVPGFALAGLISEGRRMWDLFGDPEIRAAALDYFNWPTPDAFADLQRVTQAALAVFWALLAIAVLGYLLRKLLARRRSVRIRYVDGPEVVSQKGMTLLEMSRANGVPHTSLCGGKGRCTTCRVVVEEGADLLHPPDEAEARSLAAVKAPPNTRLACQIRPTDPMTVFRVFRPEGRRHRTHASQGQERQLAILFLDMRGFTARTTGQLPYDVVFLLNRFFDAIVPAITGAGGAVDKYLGDGLLAVFEARDAAASARAALAAAEAVGHALDRFNRVLGDENDQPVRIGMSLHLGNLVLGEIGARDHAPRTIIGDTVNAASRLEGETKALGVELLVSKPLLRAAGHELDPSCWRMFDLRGVAEPLAALAVARAADLPERIAGATPQNAPA